MKVQLQIIFFLLLSFFSAPQLHADVIVHKGHADLTSYDFSNGEIAALDGEWEFYFGELLSPESVSARSSGEHAVYAKLPGIWNNIAVDGKKLKGKGCATYHLKADIRLPDEDLGLRICEAATAYRIWINGSPVAASGLV
ncbi:MAG: hypothetical protein ACRCUT_11640, partial [Spirochaetota bacterium]